MSHSTVNEQMVPNEDELIMKRILATHKPDGKEFDLQPPLDVIEDTIRHAKAWLKGKDKEVSIAGLRYQPGDLPFDTIKMVSCWFYSCNCWGYPDTIDLFHLLESYSWQAKAAIILAAFADNLGQYCLVAQLYEENHSFAKSLALLELPPNILNLKQSCLKRNFKELLQIFESVLGLVKDTAKAKIQSQPVYENYLVKAVSLIIQSIAACASQMLNPMAKAIEYEESKAGKLSDAANRIKKTLRDAEEEIQEWKKKEKVVVNKRFEQLKKRLKETAFKNSIDFLSVLSFKDNPLALYDPSAKTKGGEQQHPWLSKACDCSPCLKQRKRLSDKYVMLYISNLDDLSEDEYSYLRGKYERKSIEYELVWIPIVDESTSWNAEMKKKFANIRDSLPWLSITDPYKLDKAIIKYFKKVWKFQDKSRLVVIDPKGKVKKSGVVDLFWIWENSAFESVEEEDEEIWKFTTIQLLRDTPELQVDDWVEKEMYIFLFGGEDIDWIKRFIAAVQAVANATKIGYVMSYVGKSAMKWGRHQEVESNIRREVYRFTEKKHMSAFWATLQSLWQTKMETGKSIVEETTMKDIVTFLGFDAAREGWAAVCRGSRRTMPKLQGSPIIQMLENSAAEAKKAATGTQVFDLIDYLDYLVQNISNNKANERDHKCYSLILPTTKRTVLLRAVCIYCHKPMAVSMTYGCCIEE